VFDKRVRPWEEDSFMTIFDPTDLVGGASVGAEHLEDLGGPVRLGNRAAPDHKVISGLHIHRGTSSTSGFPSIVVPSPCLKCKSPRS
jgi:hypothetical protein